MLYTAKHDARLSPLSEKLHTEPEADAVELSVLLRYEYARGEQACGEAVSVLHVRVEVLHRESVDIYAFLLHESPSPRYPRQYHQRRLIRDVSPHVVLRRVIPV